MVVFSDDDVLDVIYRMQDKTRWTDTDTIQNWVPPEQDLTDVLARLVVSGDLEIQMPEQPSPLYGVSDQGVERLRKTGFLPAD